MGKGAREKPERLAEKLLQIRMSFNLSQGEMANRLRLDKKITRADISKYERGTREPSLLTLLRYARVVGVSLDILVDDEVDLSQSNCLTEFLKENNLGQNNSI